MPSTLRLSNTPKAGEPNLDYEWIGPDQSHIAKSILQDLAANAYQVVKKGAASGG